MFTLSIFWSFSALQFCYTMMSTQTATIFNKKQKYLLANVYQIFVHTILLYLYDK